MIATRGRGTLSPSRVIVYLLLFSAAIFYLVPMYVMLVTGFKAFDEISLQTMWQLPRALSFENFIEAYRNLAPSMWNSFRLVIPAAFISSFIGSMNGYILSKWRFRGSEILFPLLLFGMFIPYQSIMIPLTQFMRWIGMYGGIPGLILVHVVYGIPITTLIFRNYYANLPNEILESARIDGANFMSIYWYVVLPLSIPSFVVVLIWQFTQSWNDFLFAVILTSSNSWPVTVALNNMAGSQIIAWNVQMAGSFIAALPTLAVYVFLGRYFVRGLMAGALKG